MITENSFNATPEELVGKSDDTLNATATDCNPTVEEVVDAQVEAADVAAADFAEEDAALDAEKAGLAIGEEMAEEESAADVDKGDLNGRSKQELVDLFSSLLESEPVQTLRKSVEAIKIAFYKQHRAEVDAARKSFEAEHGQEAEFTPAVDALEVRLKELFYILLLQMIKGVKNHGIFLGRCFFCKTQQCDIGFFTADIIKSVGSQFPNLLNFR